MTEKIPNKVLEALWFCAASCDYCAEKCLGEVNVAQMRECIRLDRDCADICTITARFVARNSAHATHIMKECIEICQACAAECDKHSHSHCKECAQACRECIEACRSYMA